MKNFDTDSFSAGRDCGARVAASVARAAALELIDGSHWWNAWRRRLMARALVACAEEMERYADSGVGARAWLDHPRPLPSVPIASAALPAFPRPALGHS